MYKEENGTDVRIDLANLILTRENEEMLLVLNFSLGESYINMKKMNGKMPLMLTVNDKKIESNLFSVNYTLSDQNKFKFTLEWTLQEVEYMSFIKTIENDIKKEDTEEFE